MSIDKLKEVSEQLAESKRKLEEFAKNEGKSAIGAAFAECFEPPTKLEAIEWLQYTAYFNDGDPTRFRVQDPDLISIDGDEVKTWSNSKLVEAFGEATISKFNEAWDQLPDELLLAVFGDHVKIRITKDEVEVTEYSDHD